MTTRTQSITSVSSFLIGVLAIVVFDIFWLAPSFQTLRTSIDSDRASRALIIQQQSNITQLTQDLETIQNQQRELETQIWSFSTEDSFFSQFEDLSKTSKVVIDAPIIADATPTGSILTRVVSISIHGRPNGALQAVRAVQSIKPMIAINHLKMAPHSNPGEVTITVDATTLWK